MAGKVTAGPAESTDSLSPGGWLKVTCRLTGCTPISALGPTLGNKYVRIIPFSFFLLLGLALQLKKLISAFWLRTETVLQLKDLVFTSESTSTVT